MPPHIKCASAFSIIIYCLLGYSSLIDGSSTYLIMFLSFSNLIISMLSSYFKYFTSSAPRNIKIFAIVTHTHKDVKNLSSSCNTKLFFWFFHFINDSKFLYWSLSYFFPTVKSLASIEKIVFLSSRFWKLFHICCLLI